MSVDAFLSVECPQLPVKALTSSGVPNTINLVFEVGNSGTTPTTATLLKTLVVPAGVVLTVLDNGGSAVNPAGTVFTAGANSFVYTGLSLPAISGSSTTLLGFTATLQITAAVPPTTITDITQVIPGPGDVNPNNNQTICEITLQ
jgi:hypothetical protein